MTTPELTLILPDVHLPYEDKRAVANVLRMIADVQPAQVVQVGDLLDMKAPARWSKGTAAEYCNSVADEAEAGVEFWRTLRQAAPNAKLKFLMGNHEDRLLNYARNYSPALVDIIPSLPQLMKLDEFNVEYPKVQPFKVAPGVVSIHGKLLTGTAGMSARKELLRHNPERGLVQGHTHRAGVIYETTDRTRFALEAGWLGDIRKAGSYLDFPGVANWQQAFGYLYTDGKRVSPGVIPVYERGVFSFNGRSYQ